MRADEGISFWCWIKKAIFKAIQEKNYYDPSGEYENLRMDMEGYGAFFENGLSKYLKETLLSGKYVPVPATIALVLFLFPSAEEFVKALEPQNDPLFEARLKEGEYELVGPVRHNLMEIRHNKCGEVHITTAYGFGHGWSCPACDDSKTDTEIYSAMRADNDIDLYWDRERQNQFAQEYLDLCEEAERLRENVIRNIANITGTQYDLNTISQAYAKVIVRPKQEKTEKALTSAVIKMLAKAPPKREKKVLTPVSSEEMKKELLLKKQ